MRAPDFPGVLQVDLVDDRRLWGILHGRASPGQPPDWAWQPVVRVQAVENATSAQARCTRSERARTRSTRHHVLCMLTTKIRTGRWRATTLRRITRRIVRPCGPRSELARARPVHPAGPVQKRQEPERVFAQGPWTAPRTRTRRPQAARGVLFFENTNDKKTGYLPRPSYWLAAGKDDEPVMIVAPLR